METAANSTIGIQSIRDLDLKNKTVLMRLDLNVPLADPTEDGSRAITDDSRITEALPTIRMALEKGAKLVIASHLGRPDGKANPKYSLEPVALHLAGLLEQEITLADDCIGEGIELLAKQLKSGQVLLLENLRFHAEEEKNDPQFSRRLASLAEIYITDAFGTAHRKHASTYGVPSIMPLKAMGLLIEKEVQFLDRMLGQSEKPFYALFGGAKVADKIKTIQSLMTRVQGIAIGGAMAHAFWKAEGREVPAQAKQPSTEDIEAAQRILNEARRKEIPILVPSDTNGGFDIGPHSIEEFQKFLAPAKTIFWNGPLGWFEKPEYALGTLALARSIAELSAVKVIGGGDTVAAIKQSGYADRYDHLSTGGGASLEYLESGTLPGIEVLRKFRKAEATI